MRKLRNSQAFFLLRLIVTTLLLVPGLALASQDLTVNWQLYEQDDQSNEEDYWLNYTLNLNQEVTEVVSLEESIRYTRKWQQARDSEGLHPSLQFGLANDLFALNIFYYANEQRYTDQANTSQRNGEINWRSSWDKRFVPQLRTSFGKDNIDDDESPHLLKTEKETRSAGIDWDLEVLQAYYNYQWYERRDFADRSTRQTANHFGRVEAAHNFWQDRLRLGFSQQYTENQGRSIYAVDPSGIVHIQQTISQLLHGLDATPLVTAPGDLTPAPLLHDGDLVTTSGIFTNGLDSPPHNFALRVDFSTIDRIYLYTTTDVSAQAAVFVFALYASDDGSNWQLLNANVSSTYSGSNRRFELDTSGNSSQRWLKIVITTSSLQQIDYTEMEVYELASSTSSSLTLDTTSTSSVTDTNIAVQLSQRSTLSYSLNLNQGEYPSGDDFRRLNQLGELKWLNDIISAALSMSQARDRTGSRPESMNFHYNGSMGFTPLSTVNVNWGLGRTERYEGDLRQSVEHEVTLYSTLMPYPDLDATLDLIYRDTSYDQGGRGLDDYSANVIVTARLVPTLTADWKYDYRYLEGDLTTQNYGSDLILNWRPTDMFSMMTTGKSHWQDGISISDGFLVRATVAPVPPVQFSVSYTYEHTTEVINKYTTYVSWALGRYFTLQTDADYSRRAAESDWWIKIKLTGRFASQ